VAQSYLLSLYTQNVPTIKTISTGKICGEAPMMNCNNLIASRFSTGQKVKRIVTRVASGVACSGLLVAHALAATSGTSSSPTISSCPSAFHQVAITQNATQCQAFNEGLPASLVYFTTSSTQDTIRYYQDNIPNANIHAPINSRVLIVSADNTYRVVVSPDNKGAQVDILVMKKTVE